MNNIKQLAKVYKALGNTNRLQILVYINENPGCIGNDLIKVTGLAQATISQHLSELKISGIIKGKKEGKKTSYWVDLDKCYETKQLSSSFLQALLEHAI
ncbi:ArsR/SmtB family transcription factor [Zhouia sp. PK063]|uniref:ArsR/SmtB family transcription factor n=1 Tax=Zhouia sp. PK063 TaxID=3373602 RepID=UPI0037B97FD1